MVVMRTNCHSRSCDSVVSPRVMKVGRRSTAAGSKFTLKLTVCAVLDKSGSWPPDTDRDGSRTVSSVRAISATSQSRMISWRVFFVCAIRKVAISTLLHRNRIGANLG